MKAVPVLIVCALVVSSMVVRAAETDDQTAARKAATDLAGAFANDGFKTRDGFWSGTIKPAERAVVAVNLYAGNQYWFSVGTNAKTKKLEIELFDETGRQVPVESYHAEGNGAAGFSPTSSGQYYVSIGVAEAEPAVCCLIYSYK